MGQVFPRRRNANKNACINPSRGQPWRAGNRSRTPPTWPGAGRSGGDTTSFCPTSAQTQRDIFPRPHNQHFWPHQTANDRPTSQHCLTGRQICHLSFIGIGSYTCHGDA
ncbi:unnamed protein product [Protopolystoma xenopodis]|uniref:Uncharacterized protein n=1 Tax=Protopolystoma xenopodis TaxID=117903 RepID=A0A3S5AN90_9PLAT|nr:unnamed protein product [Protopolystoma xenopodis]